MLPRSAIALLWVCLALWASASDIPCAQSRVPVLLYHRFADTVQDSMTTRVSTFEAQLRLLRDGGFTVIPLRSLMDCRLGKRTTLPARAVVITADDGHRSVYELMRPIILRERLPVTLFIYPSAISNASYAMTWAQLHELEQSGLFDVQSHTYWHPNFKRERKRQTPCAYAQFVRTQLQRPKAVLTQRMGHPIDLLAWPFGIYDADLMQAATDAGYLGAFTLDAKPATMQDAAMAIPRYMIVDATGEKGFARILRDANQGG